MIQETIFSIDLPMGEEFFIKRIRFKPKDYSTKRISIVSGIHGDELEGQYVTYLLIQFLNQYADKLAGIIDIYPSINSVGIDSIERLHVPSEIDINRAFPGSPSGLLPYRIAYNLVEAVKGSEIAIDIHSSNIFLKEIPQVRISQENANNLKSLAEQLNVDFIWIHEAVTVLQSTFSHSMNKLGTKTLVVEMGVGMRITQEYCHQLFEGIIHLLVRNGFLKLEYHKPIKKPICSIDGEVYFFNADKPGIFIPDTEHNKYVLEGDIIGRIISPIDGNLTSEIKSPCNGLVFTLREYPVVYEGSLIARLYREII